MSGEGAGLGLGGTADAAVEHEAEGGLDLGGEVAVGAGAAGIRGREARDDGCRGGCRFQRGAKLDAARGREHLDRQDPGQAVDGPALIWFEIAEEQNVFPMMPAGKGLSDLIEKWDGPDE